MVWSWTSFPVELNFKGYGISYFHFNWLKWCRSRFLIVYVHCSYVFDSSYYSLYFYIIFAVLSLSILSLNARGLRNSVKRKALFLFAKQFRTDFCFFQESHSILADANFWRSQWGNDIWLSRGSERSAGVTTLKNTFDGNILHSECDPFGHFICLVISYNDIMLITVNFYRYNTKHENDQLQWHYAHYCKLLRVQHQTWEWWVAWIYRETYTSLVI